MRQPVRRSSDHGRPLPSRFPGHACVLEDMARELHRLRGRERVMRAAIPLYGNRVSPRFGYSRAMLVVDIVDGQATQQRIVNTEEASDAEWLDRLIALGVEVFVCGAADATFLQEGEGLGIRVIPDVAGEIEQVLAGLANGSLQPGYGTYRGLSGAPQDEAIDCLRCRDRVCLAGRPCPGLVPDLHCRTPEPDEGELLEVATDISCETGRRLCRVAEFVHFCHGMGYQHVGVAFCVELYRETQILAHLLRRFLRITPVCCKIGGQRISEEEIPGRPCHVACNPAGQAAELGRHNTEINAIVGLCIGCDLVFAQHSRAPVTTLFVKDRSLANNPVGALYSNYYLTELADGPRPAKASSLRSTRQGVEL
jgi:uncharacterized metal-binding protein/predicted Fe-Mo cluster-binding NifX family protein